MHAMTLPRVRMFLLSAVVAALVAAVVFAMQRELAPRGATGSGEGSGPAQPLALSADEEAYAAALWPIHSEVVESSAVALSFAGIAYVTDHHDAHKLTMAASRLHDMLEAADARARALAVPDSMHPVQDRYLEAITLLKGASAEMLKVETDSKIEHLETAQRMSYVASEDLLKVGDVLWPGEHKPN